MALTHIGITKGCLQHVNNLLMYHRCNFVQPIQNSMMHGIPVLKADKPLSDTHKEELHNLLQILIDDMHLAVVIFNHYLMITWVTTNKDVTKENVDIIDLNTMFEYVGINFRFGDVAMTTPQDIVLKPEEVHKGWNDMGQYYQEWFKRNLKEVLKEYPNTSDQMQEILLLIENDFSATDNEKLLLFLEILQRHKANITDNIQAIVNYDESH